jgi:hypothetical protein
MQVKLRREWLLAQPIDRAMRATHVWSVALLAAVAMIMGTAIAVSRSPTRRP